MQQKYNYFRLQPCKYYLSPVGFKVNLRGILDSTKKCFFKLQKIMNKV